MEEVRQCQVLGKQSKEAPERASWVPEGAKWLLQERDFRAYLHPKVVSGYLYFNRVLGFRKLLFFPYIIDFTL